MVNIKALAATIAILWGTSLAIVGWGAAFGFGDLFVNVMSSLYIGYAPGFTGGLIGGIWGALDGAVTGLITGYIYNYIAK
jgi:hypothetical protein